MEVRVAIFEDNKLVRDALQAILSGTPGYSCTGAFADGNRWEMDIKRSEPDVVLMDIEMPGLNGIEITKLIGEKFPDVKILIQTVFNDSERIFQALCAGASGYILKSTPPDKILQAIREVEAGGAFFTPSIAKKVLFNFQQQPEKAEYIRITEKEKEVLKLLVDGLSYKMIADRTALSFHTIHSHIKNIYEKLHVNSKGEAVAKAIKNKLI